MLGSPCFVTTLFLIEIATCVRVYEDEKTITNCQVNDQHFCALFWLGIVNVNKRIAVQTYLLISNYKKTTSAI